MKQIIILAVLAIILIGVVVFLYSGGTDRPALEIDIGIESKESPGANIIGQAKTVMYSDSGYSPATITVNRGDTVVFNNKGTKMMWTASAVHPTHKAYPNSDIAKCETQSQAGIFDACGGYGLGELWEFKFNEQGTWKYHNHLQPNDTGAIIVE